jgi:DNA replication protein DnaC
MNPSPSEPTRIKPEEFVYPVKPENEKTWQEEQDEIEARRAHEAAIALWRAANVPSRHADTTPGENEAWRAASGRVAGLLGSGCIILLHGKRGTGKTQLAVEAIRATCKRGRSARYVKAIEIFLDIRDSFGGERSEKAAVRAYTAPYLLVIDAMEERGETPFEDRLLNHIIDRRYDDCKDTIIITNQTKQEFAASAGPSIVSRIIETGDTIECAWDTFRVKRGEA